MKTILTVATASAVLLATSAVALETSCTAPSAPQLPPSITSQTELSMLEVSTISYLTEASAYHQCLINYAEANDATLTQADRTELRSLYDAQSAASKAYSEEWNEKLTSFMASE